jgi:hypothetical protein
LDRTSTAGQEVPNFWIKPKLEPERWPNTTRYLTPSNDFAPSKKLIIVLYTQNNLTLCEVSTQYVDSFVDCSLTTRYSDPACSIRKMRRSPRPPLNGNFTARDVRTTDRVLTLLPFTMANDRAEEFSVIEKWLLDPPLVFLGLGRLPSGIPGFQTVAPRTFSDRFAMALNTWTRASFNRTITVGSDSGSLKDIDTQWENTTGTWTAFTDPVYYIDVPWFIVYIVSALVLSFCAIANIVLRSLIFTPDIFSSIVALTRDSQFFNTPTPASGMDGSERSRLLQDKWVMIQDIRPDEAVGRIAFSDNGGLAPLARDRKYM